MKTRALVLTLSAAAGLVAASCAQLGIMGGDVPIDKLVNATASATVTVTACNPQSVSVNPNSIRVQPGTKTTITWQITNPNYDFPQSGGIVHKGNPPAGVFSQGMRQGPGVYTMDDMHVGPKSKGDFPYKIVIRKADGSACTEHDPDIMNG